METRTTLILSAVALVAICDVISANQAPSSSLIENVTFKPTDNGDNDHSVEISPRMRRRTNGAMNNLLSFCFRHPSQCRDDDEVYSRNASPESRCSRWLLFILAVCTAAKVMF